LNKQLFENKAWFLATVILLLFVAIVIVPPMFAHPNMEHRRGEFISLKENIQDDMRHEENYQCCLEKPCMYCIEKTPGHGEGAECQCLDDIVNGRHPCGECIGEILEGHGNPHLTEYFAVAIAEEVGEEHLPTLQMIIKEKYGEDA